MVPLSVNPTGEIVLNQSQLTFTPQNFNVPQKVRVTALADGKPDGNKTLPWRLAEQAYHLSSDAKFNGLMASFAFARLTWCVSRPALKLLAPIPKSLVKMVARRPFDVSLTTQPAADVTIAVSSSDITEGTVSKSPLADLYAR